jgi:hypothetical protein
MLNCKLLLLLLLLLWPKKTYKVQKQPRQWATYKDVHFGQFGKQFGKHSCNPQYEVELTKLAL